MFINISSWVVYLLTTGIALYWYWIKRNSHWKRAGIPYVPALPVIGSFWSFIGKSPLEVETGRYRTKGRIYGLYELGLTLVVGEPEIIKDILVKDFHLFTDRRGLPGDGGNRLVKLMLPNINGESWKRIRTLVTPTFTTGKIKKMTSIFIDSAKTLSENFKKAADQKKPLDVKRYFGAFTMDVIASCAFAIKLDSHSDPNNPFVTTAKSVFSKNFSWRFLLIFLFPDLANLLRFSPFDPAPLEFFRNVTLNIIKERNQSGKKRNDFLQLMLDAETEFENEQSITEKDAISEMGHEENNDQIFKPTRVLKSLSHDEMVAQCVVFFFGGYDTTASTLAIATYELARNPDVQEKLIGEIDEAIKQKGELSYDSVSEMKYLDCVVAETLRKYPPGVRAERVAKDDYAIKNHNITVTKGMVVAIPVYALHHDPEFYPNPEIFDPERFTPEMKASRPSFAYLPFGAGPRNCVAMRFALMEIKVCLAYILSQFRFRTCSETAVPLKFYFGGGVLSPKEVMLEVEVRTDSAQL